MSEPLDPSQIERAVRLATALTDEAALAAFGFSLERSFQEYSGGLLSVLADEDRRESQPFHSLLQLLERIGDDALGTGLGGWIRRRLGRTASAEDRLRAYASSLEKLDHLLVDIKRELSEAERRRDRARIVLEKMQEYEVEFRVHAAACSRVSQVSVNSVHAARAAARAAEFARGAELALHSASGLSRWHETQSALIGGIRSVVDRLLPAWQTEILAGLHSRNADGVLDSIDASRDRIVSKLVDLLGRE